MAGRKERRGPREEAVACTVDPLRVDKTERGEGRNESGRRFNAPPPPLSEMANRWRPPRSWYRRIIRFVTRYRITLAVYLSTRETPGLGKYWFERDGVYFRPSFRRYRFYGVEKKRISFNTRDKNILYQRQFNVHNLHRVLKVLIRMLYNFRTTSVS